MDQLRFLLSFSLSLSLSLSFYLSPSLYFSLRTIPWLVHSNAFGHLTQGIKDALAVSPSNSPAPPATNQNSLFRSRDWISSNQGPVFLGPPNSSQSKFLFLFIPHVIPSMPPKMRCCRAEDLHFSPHLSLYISLSFSRFLMVLGVGMVSD